MQFTTAILSVVALCFAIMVASSPIPVALPEAAVVEARDPQACRLINSCI
ncbi:hypothetical protein DFP72DRAFT_1065568 [Ephemerocybe angulata]|uniref:Uncharacterized protein n=1 Tax=Ephemerocybe angulata TaxID=980116 RepID=A0A8H6I2L9_9AGAR|nr:hypothetical protein DFP72DRAFT_1065568 [Tulosesus angulatus]